MKLAFLFSGLGFLGLTLAGCGGGGASPAAFAPAPPPATAPETAPALPLWRGVHFLSPGRDGLPILLRAIDERLAPMGVNVILYEINYGYEFESHPELRAGVALSREDVKALLAVCRKHNIRLIPQFNCLGHQSWAQTTFPLLSRYPEFDETPWVPADNKGIYCRSWCPLHPDVNPIIFALMDELIEAFEADAFHVGLDEVFLLADSRCPRCAGRDPAELFARAVTDYHDHLVKKRGLTMLMWGDRLLDAKATGYSDWEASGPQSGTAPAIDLLPRDIVMCDWHYGLRGSYPSVKFFQEKGFRVWPASWNFAPAARALFNDSRREATPLLLGHLCTTWYDAREVAAALLGEASWLDTQPGAFRVAQVIRILTRDQIEWEAQLRGAAALASAASSPDSAPESPAPAAVPPAAGKEPGQ